MHVVYTRALLRVGCEKHVSNDPCDEYKLSAGSRSLNGAQRRTYPHDAELLDEADDDDLQADNIGLPSTVSRT